MLSTVDGSFQRRVRSRPVLELPTVLDRSVHDLVDEQRLSVSPDGCAAAFFERVGESEYALRHTNPRVGFRSNRISRILYVEDNRALIWAKAELEPMGLYLAEPGQTRFVARLDRLKGVRRISLAPGVDSVAAYGRNVDDPVNTLRFASLAGSFETPPRFTLPSTNGDVIMCREDGWVRSSFHDADFVERLPFAVGDIDAVLQVYWHRLPVYVLRKRGKWHLWSQRETFELPGIVRQVMCSPTQSAFALLVEAPPVPYELFRTPLRTLIVTGPASETDVRTVYRGRFEIEDLRWSPNGAHLAACVKTIPGELDDDEDAVPTSMIVTSARDRVVAHGAETLAEPLIASSGELLAHAKATTRVRRVVAPDHVSREIYAWQPQELPGRSIAYSAVNGNAVTRVTLLTSSRA